MSDSNGHGGIPGIALSAAQASLILDHADLAIPVAGIPMGATLILQGS